VRVVVTGATGNVGTSVLRALQADPAVDSIVGVARRAPRLAMPKTSWTEADVTSTDLVPVVAGADVVVHLAWAIQPSRDLELMRRTNVAGSQRVFRAVADADVPALVVASSVGAYSPGPRDRSVDETWPTNGIATSFYSRHKAAVERLLDSFEREHPDVRMARLRPALSFKREAASEIRRLFLGPLVPTFLLKPGRIPIVPHLPALRFQSAHSDDVGQAYRLAATRDVRGAFNIAADPVLDTGQLARMLQAKAVRVPARVIRAGAAVTYHLHLQPTEPGWVDMALQSPVMDTARARTELGWVPEYSANDAVAELLEGLRHGAGVDTPPLEKRSRAGGPRRLRRRALAPGDGREATR
jgi:UDP-glucose 4-epimerase